MANALSPEQITALLSGAKVRGQYDDELKAFIARGNRGEQVDLEAGSLAGKKPQSVKMGFENAKKKLDDELKVTIQIVLHEEQVFLINKAVEA